MEPHVNQFHGVFYMECHSLHKNHIFAPWNFMGCKTGTAIL